MTRLLVGTYAARGGAGLVPLVRDPAARRWQAGAPIGHIRNASFGIVSAGGRRVFFVDEAENGVGAYDPARDWQTLGTCPAGGEAPCHLAMSPDGRHLAVAHYASGTTGIFALKEGSLAASPAVKAHPGRGPDPDRQDRPHAHWVGFSAAAGLIAVDLGADRVFAHPLAGDGTPHILYAAPPGSGPRHLAFHPVLPLAYLVSELASTLTVLAVDRQDWRAITILPTVPAGRTGDNLGGAIAIDPQGRRLHLTNRGHDSIVSFMLDDHGQPRDPVHVDSGGRSPRHLLLRGDMLAVAHEESGSVALFPLDAHACPTPGPEIVAVPGAAFLMVDPVLR